MSLMYLVTGCTPEHLIMTSESQHVRSEEVFKSSDHKPELVVQKGHAEDVTAVVFSADGTLLATGSQDDTVKLWDTRTGKEIRTFIGHSEDVTGLAFSPNGKYLASGSGHGIVKLWDTRNGQELSSLKAHQDKIMTMAFSPDSQTLVTGSWGYHKAVSFQHPVKLWDVTTGRKLHEFKAEVSTENKFSSGSQLNCVTFSPDGQILAAGRHDGNIFLWNLERSLFKRQRLSGHGEEITALAFSSNGKMLASGGRDATIRLWDMDTGKLLHILSEHSDTISSLSFTKDSTQLISVSKDNTCKVWEVRTGQGLHTSALPPKIGTSQMVVLSPDYDVAASLSRDNTITLWDTRTGRTLRMLTGHSIGSITSVTFNPDGHIIASSSDNTVKLLDLSSGRTLHMLKGHSNTISAVAISPDGDLVASGSWDHTVKLWDSQTNQELKTLSGHSARVVAVAFSPDGKTIVSGSWDRTMKLWDVATGKELFSFPGHTESVLSVAFSPDNRLVASSSWDKTIRIWDVHTKRNLSVLTERTGWVASIAFSPDGQRLVSGGRDKRLKVWDVQTGTVLHTLTGHTDSILAVAFSSDGRLIASGSQDHTVKLWDPQIDKAIHTFSGHTKAVTAMMFSPNGRLIASGSRDETIKFWDVSGGKELITCVAFDTGEYVLATPDSYYLASKGGLKGVAFRIGNRAYPFEQFDLKLNRPDLILQRLGFAPQSLLDAYHQAYRKRLKKMHFTEAMLRDDFHLPEITILTAPLPLSTIDKTFSVKISASDSKYLLDRLNIYINGVPMYGIQGKNLQEHHTSEHTTELSLPLSNGWNNIKLSVLNQSGAESMSEIIEMTYIGTPAQENIYVVSIGVSKYTDEQFNLDYAAKDATDVISLFQKYAQTFGETYVKQILDTNATKQQILAVKDLLKQSKSDDLVILFFAGHGLLDEQFDYYFATTDIDFNHPSERGLLYEEIEALLDDIPARKKLLLMDTCHSGEVDKDDLQMLTTTTVEGGTVRGRSVRGLTLAGQPVSEQSESAQQKQQLGLKNSFELLRELFADLRRGSGAMVISSASGFEFAFESEKWLNGVFTYSLLQGLQGKADADSDQKVRISELWNYVTEKVQRLTHNSQTPTIRRENLEFDFRVLSLSNYQ